MNLDWTEEQAELHERLRILGATELGHDLEERDRSQRLQEGDWKRCADAGVLALPLPEAYGGAGRDPLTCAIAMEGLGHGCPDNGLLISLGAHLWAVALPVMVFGTDEQKRRYLTGLGDGSLIGAHAITEAGSGSDAMALAMTATRDGDRYVLNGGKRFVTNAPIADVFVVHATLDPELGFTGVTAFIVERNQPGVSVETRFEKSGLRTAPWGELTLENVSVPVSRRLGAEKQGSRILATTMAWERALLLAPLLGTMRRQIDECVEYAHSRKQFGQPIGRFQSVSNRIVDMWVRLEQARLLTYRAGWDLAKAGPSVYSEAAQMQVSEAAVATFQDAMQIFGALGYTKERDAERNLRDALGTRISSGTTDIQRLVMAERLGVTGGARRPATGAGGRAVVHSR
ncbi:acyl-CoA dehydrogenase family protein [Streptomyces macrosporus]|uniref:Acyl-CoA dehydrogenase family protein n=1 Tax=Streptomyces macrosporus TaxID=44032 RepID=A0ABP5WHF2_9ACTN